LQASVPWANLFDVVEEKLDICLFFFGVTHFLWHESMTHCPLNVFFKQLGVLLLSGEFDLHLREEALNLH
jgi:hypothetical protein